MQLNQEEQKIIAELKSSKTDDLCLLHVINKMIEIDQADGREATVGSTALAVMARVARTNELIEVISNGR
jgi:hypothetical protein